MQAVIYGIEGLTLNDNERAFLSDAQASWLFTILTNFERGPTSRSSKARTPAGSTTAAHPPSSSEKASESFQLERAHAGLDNISWTEEGPPRGFDLSEALIPDGGD